MKIAVRNSPHWKIPLDNPAELLVRQSSSELTANFQRNLENSFSNDPSKAEFAVEYAGVIEISVKTVETELHTFVVRSFKI